MRLRFAVPPHRCHRRKGEQLRSDAAAERQDSRRSRLLLPARVGLLAIVAVLLTLILPSPAFAWRRVQDIVRGTADTLEKGRLTVGIFAPAMYGITDALTIASHPILDLLLVPNLDVRYRVSGDDTWVLAAYGGYKQGFQPVETSGVAGQTHLGVMATRYLVDRVALSAGFGWSGRIDRTVTLIKSTDSAGVVSTSSTSDLTMDHGICGFLNASWLIDDRHVLMVTSQARLGSFGLEDQLLTGAFVFARGSFQFVVGASLGAFELRSLKVTADSSVVATWPVMPYVDIWWDF